MSHPNAITFNGAQLAQLRDFTDDERDAEISIGWFQERMPDSEGNEMPAGHYAWFTEHPEEGAIYLQPTFAGS